MKVLLAVAALTVAAVPAAADQGAAMKAKLAASKGVGPAVIPTGIEVDGCTWLTHLPGRTVERCDRLADNFNSPDFWKVFDREGSGSIEVAASAP